MPKKPFFSPSQIEMSERCELQYQFRYLEGKKVPPGVAMITGTAVDRSVQANLKHKIATKGELLSAEAVKDTAAESLRNTWAGEGPLLLPEEKEKGEHVVKGEAVDKAVALATLHHAELAPVINPTHVQRQVYVELNGFDRDLMGYLDVQEANRIRDTKTTAKTPSGDEADESTQLTFYSLAADVIDGKTPRTLSLDYLIHTKTPKVQVLETTRTDDDYQRLLKRVALMSQTLQSGVFRPAPRGAWNCCEKWCGYWKDICPFGRRNRTQA